MEPTGKRTGGVADYFAILGVGEKLVWKHSQKKSAHETTVLEEEEEDEAALVERFYREIIEVTIIASTAEQESSDDTEIRSVRSPSSPQQRDIRSVQSSSSLQQPYTASIPNSLSHCSDSTPNPSLFPHDSALPSQAQLYGFTVVQRTCPAGKSLQAVEAASSLGGLLSVNDSSATDQSSWQKSQVLDADLCPLSGLRAELLASNVPSAIETTPLRDLGRRLGTSLRKFNHGAPHPRKRTKFHLGFRRRGPDETDRPAIADVLLRFVKIHVSTLNANVPDDEPSIGMHSTTVQSTSTTRSAALKRGLVTGAHFASRVVAEAGKHRLLKHRKDEQLFHETAEIHGADAVIVPLGELLPLPGGFEEWSIPDDYRWLKFTNSPRPKSPHYYSARPMSPFHLSEHKTVIVPKTSDVGSDTSSGFGIEAYMESALYSPLEHKKRDSWDGADLDVVMPKLLPEQLPDVSEMQEHDDYVYIPILAVRRQRTGDEERYHEDPGVVDMAVTFCDASGNAVLPDGFDADDDCADDQDEGSFNLLNKSKWSNYSLAVNSEGAGSNLSRSLGTPQVLVKRNMPIGFADAAFATKVLDRFPVKNYKGLPLPEEELPMFCYPTGCRLHRARFSDAPLPQYYGFVVKNERGDSIHVSCVSFMEPLAATKIKQLNRISERRSRVSLANSRYCKEKEGHVAHGPGSAVSDLRSYDDASETRRHQNEASQGIVSAPPSETSWRDDYCDGMFLTGFGDMTTFENKTICLISRFPFWTAFRRFLSHLHVLSGSSSDLPLERCISHLLLSVHVPKAGGPCVIVPLPALNGPMILSMPPAKDFPLVDLPFHRLLACLDVPTIVTIVLGFLALERKLIIMSSRPSLVLDGCELLRSLLFPFELCAPYVPRLTQPFMSCLDFPGAIFVGIHDDGSPDGLASLVRNNLPEDSAIVDLDTGEIDCSGDRYQVLKQCWGVIPAESRTVLVSEVETLCRDAGIVPGQEPLESQVDSAFNPTIPSGLVVDYGAQNSNVREPLDDRAVRDAFLRFFCSVLGGYERHLVVPDVDFLVSGNEWFDAQGFLSAASQERAPYLGSIVTTQLFQSFIQRRTEASDVHCLLFDECLAEYHSSSVPYGRLGGDVETVANSRGGPPEMLYSLLVDQCSTEAYHASWDEDDGTGLKSVDSSAIHAVLSTSSITLHSAEATLPGSGDIVTTPSRQNLPEGVRFVYCIDGNPCFPQRLDSSLFYPPEPQVFITEMSETPRPILARTEREVEEAQRRRKAATTYRGLHTQRRCLWQLPKLMGSHFLGAWLLCVPAQVSQPNLSNDQQTRYLLRALGALRQLRNKQRIVADEAGYRALIAACGRTGNDRRTELVKLFGLLRSDGIFPSAVTLGQYTRALAEGYSKRSFGMPDDNHGGVEVTVSASKDGRVEISGKDDVDAEGVLNAFDGNLVILEDSGRQWRQHHAHNREPTGQRKTTGIGVGSRSNATSPARDSAWRHSPATRRSQRPWLPVTTSSSFVPFIRNSSSRSTLNSRLDVDTRLVALWSRTRSCDSCAYLPLDEEIQSGWDVVGGQSDIPHTVKCPRCGSLFLPMLGYQEMTLQEALALPAYAAAPEFASGVPRQIIPYDVDDINKKDEGKAGFVAYLDPSTVRASLERYVNEEGEDALDRDGLRERDPELFYNFWWYCARFSFPLPLPISANGGALHYCAFAAWDSSIAFHGCHSGVRALAPLYGFQPEQEQGLSTAGSEERETPVTKEPLGEFPLLSRFNLQAICQGDWDHNDLSEILVTLVEACDKRDLRPVLECVFHCNKRRLAVAREARSDVPIELGLLGSASSLDSPSVELDCYRTLLYLAKYQCTSVFHVFFPETAKPCKGYHFWCAIGTPLPIFDHLFREAVKRIRAKDTSFTPIHDISDVALGFRCVFGQII